MENSLTIYDNKAKTIPISKILFHLKGILAITNAKVTTAVCSGIPCKSKAINGMFINHTTSPTKHQHTNLQRPTILPLISIIAHSKGEFTRILSY